MTLGHLLQPHDMKKSFIKLVPSFLRAKSALRAPIVEEPLCMYRPGGYHPVQLGDILHNSRYTVVHKLGWGQYSTVWLARDTLHNRHVALKILTDDAGKGNTRLPEVEVLQQIEGSDPHHPGRKHIATLLHHFRHTGPNGSHVCMAFDVLGLSIAALQKQFPKRSMPSQLVKTISFQVLLALDYLHRSCGIIHTDIKPDNMLLCLGNNELESIIQNHITRNPPRVHHSGTTSPNVPSIVVESRAIDPERTGPVNLESLTLKVTDLGVASWVDRHLVDVVQSPPLRAPEVVLGGPWGTGVDIWGFACVIYYLFSGRWLFNPKSSEEPRLTAEEEHIVQMITLLGQFPIDLIQSGKQASTFFNVQTGNLRRIIIPDDGMTSLDQVVSAWAPKTASPQELAGITNFLGRMLQIRPVDRASARDLINDPWLKGTGDKFPTTQSQLIAKDE